MPRQPGFLRGTGEMGEIYRAKDWSTCALGAPEGWPSRLQGYVDMVLRLPTGCIVFWGPDQIQLYNLKYSEIMGPRHPRYLGAPYRECWPDTYPTIYPWMRRVLDEGEVIEVTDALIPVTRYGFDEDTYFTFSFVPLRGDDGRIEGFIQHIAETTKIVLAERRLATLRSIAARDGDVIASAADAFRANLHDLPFAAILVPDREVLIRVEAMPAGLDVSEPHVIPWGSTRAMVLPLRTGGALLLGISPRLVFDDTYRAFFEGCARELASNLAAEEENRIKAQLADELRKRAEALTELDRAKTAFFSNVSHEFRTPLTLMLGPIDDALAGELSDEQRERLQLVARSGQRMFKLVNTLLDFSRIEAGRTQVKFEPIELAELTAGLASAFRSLVERAGLRLIVDCPPLGQQVWVDREMWEKIVLNLISNAFKFTFSGEIAVALRAVGDTVELSVRDTGTGIPAGELPRLFDRFHRVEGAKGRSFEGSGIGLALVQELAKLLGGDVRVESTEGVGSVFTVSLPTDVTHERAREQSGRAPVPGAAASQFVREAEAWTEHTTTQVVSEHGAKVLLADDNPDMRDYVRGLLAARYQVRTVGNGAEALAAIRDEVPDLVLTDVMMPELDGFGLLAALKGDPRTRLIPVILLSARAGEESRVEGMEAGADDYLVKPFAARELLARVAARLEIARVQARMAAELERLVLERTAQLREANQELESFSYSVSHDLRAPLRHILGFSQLLGKATALEGKAAGYLKTIADAAERGGKLVDDLLAFSRMGRSELRRQPVDLTRLVAEVRQELAPDQENRQVTWRVHELPIVQGDPALLRLVVKNLLSNALKYTRTRAEAVIEVGAREREVYVRDNGVGFDMRYVDKLFGVFQRLHASEQFEGNGIGLALVRRIVTRHGGTTMAQGAIEQGATISFTLP